MLCCTWLAISIVWFAFTAILESVFMYCQPSLFSENASVLHGLVGVTVYQSLYPQHSSAHTDAFVTFGTSPRPSRFSRATLKSWEWPGTGYVWSMSKHHARPGIARALPAKVVEKDLCVVYHSMIYKAWLYLIHWDSWFRGYLWPAIWKGIKVQLLLINHMVSCCYFLSRKWNELE